MDPQHWILRYLILNENIFLSMATKNCQAGSGSVWILNSSVADPGCLSRIPDPPFIHPGFSVLSIPDPGSRVRDPTTAPKRGGGIKFVCPTIFSSHKYHKIVNNFIFEQITKIFLVKTLRILGLFTQKLSLSYQKYGFGIRDPGSKRQRTGSTKLLNSH